MNWTEQRLPIPPVLRIVLESKRFRYVTPLATTLNSQPRGVRPRQEHFAAAERIMHHWQCDFWRHRVDWLDQGNGLAKSITTYGFRFRERDALTDLVRYLPQELSE